MATSTPSDDLKRDIQATLAARRELGSAYDDHFIDALVGTLKRQVVQELRETVPARKPAAPSRTPYTVEQRLAVAVVSLVVVFVALLTAALLAQVPDNDWFASALAIFAAILVLLNVAMNVGLRLRK